MITEKQYQQARQQKDEADEIIRAYHQERAAQFDQRIKDNPIFVDEELVYSATILCPCGYGLAYPKGCGIHYFWDCSAILRGIASGEVAKGVQHTAQLPFTFYDIKGESEHRGTTRGVFRPKEPVK